MTVHCNLGQMLALTQLIHNRMWAHSMTEAKAMGRHPEPCPPVVAYLSDGSAYTFRATGKVNLNGVNVDHIYIHTNFIPVIPKWWGEDMDPIWEDMYVTTVMDWESEGFESINVVAAVWKIING